MKIGEVVGENIRGFRNAKGWSQEKLGTRSGLHYNYLGTVERGEKSLKVDNLGLVAKGLDVPIVRSLKKV